MGKTKTEARCGSCPWWVREQPPEHPWYGHCTNEKEPQTVNDESVDESVWPVTVDDDWCELHPDRRPA